MKHLSPRRVAVALAAAAATAALVPAAADARFVINPPASPKTFTGPASQRGIATGVVVSPGDVITGSVSSDLNICDNGPGCPTGDISTFGQPNDSYFISGQEAGGEYYRIGDGPWTAFTRSETNKAVSRPVTADRAGEVTIATNDFNNDAYYADNRGTLSISTEVRARGKGITAVGTTFDFIATPLGGHARLDMNPDRRYGLREGDVTCFNQVGNRAVFGILDTAGSKPVYREFAIQDGGTTGTDRLNAIGIAHSVAPPATCSNAVPRTVRNVIRSGDIVLAAATTQR